MSTQKQPPIDSGIPVRSNRPYPEPEKQAQDEISSLFHGELESTQYYSVSRD